MIKHEVRTDNGGTAVVELSARKAIMVFCKECVGFNPDEVRRCTDKLCPLFPFRLRDTCKVRGPEPGLKPDRKNPRDAGKKGTSKAKKGPMDHKSAKKSRKPGKKADPCDLTRKAMTKPNVPTIYPSGYSMPG